MKDRNGSIIFSLGESFDPSSRGSNYTSNSEDNMKQEWRRYGATRRKELIEKDEKDGGTRFELHKKCRIEQYFNIADRVSNVWERKRQPERRNSC